MTMAKAVITYDITKTTIVPKTIPSPEPPTIAIQAIATIKYDSNNINQQTFSSLVTISPPQVNF